MKTLPYPSNPAAKLGGSGCSCYRNEDCYKNSQLQIAGATGAGSGCNFDGMKGPEHNERVHGGSVDLAWAEVVVRIAAAVVSQPGMPAIYLNYSSFRKERWS